MTDSSNLTLGQFLRHEREARGITIEQVASATKIGVRQLHALESDQYTELPAKPFVLGFVTSYVRFIGLEPKEVLTTYGDFINRKAHDRPTHEEGFSGYAFEKREGEQSRTFLWIVMGGFIVVGVVLFLVLKPSLHRSRGKHVEKLKTVHGLPSPGVSALPSVLPSPVPPAAPVSEVPLVAVKPSPQPAPELKPEQKPAEKKEQAPAAPTPSPTPTATATDKPGYETSAKDPLNSGVDLKPEEIKHKAVMRAVDDVWVRFQVDNRKPMRFILRKERVLVLRAREVIRFQASDPKSVRFNYNGSAAKLMTDEKSLVTRQGDLTLILPAEVAESIKEPFPGAVQILRMPVPPSPTSTPSPSPAP